MDRRHLPLQPRGRPTQLAVTLRTMTLLTKGLAFLALVGYVAGAAIERRAVIPHDQVAGFPETVPNNNIGQLYLKFKPRLKVVNGCVPFPAVDASGNTRLVCNVSHALIC